jgi:hypothetical protein
MMSEYNLKGKVVVITDEYHGLVATYY